MKAAVLHKLGEAPRYAEFADPVAGAEEVLVRVRAASLKNVERQMAAGTHYASPREFPVVCGIDGVGNLDDGTRVFFGGARKPFGAMAEVTVAPRAFCFPLSDALDDLTAAALPNPGVSAWLTLTHGAKIAAGETALILGATGVTGQLAVQIAKLHGAKRVVAAGRNESALAKLKTMGADETIQIAQSDEALKKEFARAAGDDGFDVIIDYLWGRPTELLIAAITKSEFAPVTKQTRLVQVGESAGPTITLPAAVLRSTALTIMGTAGIPPMPVLMDAMNQVLTRGASGELRIETEAVPLAEVERAWQQKESSGRRIVFVP
jgi:NADPH:quinone reductase-like Zn-dependent oxidoreductase